VSHVFGTLTVDGRTVTFGTARRGLGGAAERLAVPNVTARPSTASAPLLYNGPLFCGFMCSLKG